MLKIIIVKTESKIAKVAYFLIDLSVDARIKVRQLVES
jgi:hypothetical protein